MDPKLLTVFLSCAKEKHLWKDWGIHQDSVILCGDPLLKEDFVLKTDIKGKFTILYLKCEDTYENLPHKMICAFHAIYNCDIFNDYSHIWKCDPVDTLINEPRLNKIYGHIDHESKGTEALDYGCRKIGPGKLQNSEYHYGKVTPNSFWDNKPYSGSFKNYALGGSDQNAGGYILSRRSLHCLTNFYHPHQREVIYSQHIYEDLMVGLVLNKFSITPVALWY